MLEEDKLFEFAKECAAIYCQRRSAWSQFDDATQEACLFLLKNRDKWTLPQKFLRKQTVFALVRWYQNERRLRRQRKLERVDMPTETLFDANEQEQKIEAREIVELAIANAKETSGIFRDYLEGRTLREIAEKHGTTTWRALEVVKNVKREIAKLSDEPLEGEKEECPLLYPEKWSRTES